MNLINRAKNILLTPKTEWNVVAGETATLGSLLTSYVIPMALIPTAASLLSALLWTGRLFGMKYAIIAACGSFVGAIISYVVTTYVVDLLAPNFQSKKDLGSSAQLVAYSGTASWVASILGIVPILGWLGMIAGGIYAIYLMYLGLGPVKKTPDDQKAIYLVVAIIVFIVVSILIGWILMAMFWTGVATKSLYGM